MVLCDQLLQLSFGLLHLILGCGGINHFRVQHLTGGVHHRKLTSRAERRIPAQHHLTGNGRLQQKLFQIFAEYTDSAILRLFRHVIAYLALDGRGNETLIAILYGLLNQGSGMGIFRGYGFLLQITADPLPGRIYFDCQNFLGFPPVNGQHPVSRNLLHRLLKIVIHLVYALDLLVPGRACHNSLFHSGFPDVAAVVRIVGNILRNDILCTLNGFLRGLYTSFFFRILPGHISGRFFRYRPVCLLRQNILCQPFQPFLPGHTGTCLSLGSVGTV